MAMNFSPHTVMVAGFFITLGILRTYKQEV